MALQPGAHQKVDEVLTHFCRICVTAIFENQGISVSLTIHEQHCHDFIYSYLCSSYEMCVTIHIRVL